MYTKKKIEKKKTGFLLSPHPLPFFFLENMEHIFIAAMCLFFNHPATKQSKAELLCPLLSEKDMVLSPETRTYANRVAVYKDTFAEVEENRKWLASQSPVVIDPSSWGKSFLLFL
jgi:hypothetical protein